MHASKETKKTSEERLPAHLRCAHGKAKGPLRLLRKVGGPVMPFVICSRLRMELHAVAGCCFWERGHAIACQRRGFFLDFLFFPRRRFHVTFCTLWLQNSSAERPLLVDADFETIGQFPRHAYLLAIAAARPIGKNGRRRGVGLFQFQPCRACGGSDEPRGELMLGMRRAAPCHLARQAAPGERGARQRRVASRRSRV